MTPQYPDGRSPSDPYQQPQQQPWPEYGQPQQPYGQAPPQQQPYQQQPPPPGPPPRRRRKHGKLRAIAISAASLFAAIIAIAAATGGHGQTPAPVSATSAAAPAAAASTTAPAAAAAPSKITYEVTGTPGAQVTYGPAGSDLNGSVPMHVTARLGNAEYYDIQAQLQGSGDVTVKILINGKVISSGHASGGYNIAMAEISQDPITGQWQDTQS